MASQAGRAYESQGMVLARRFQAQDVGAARDRAQALADNLSAQGYGTAVVADEDGHLAYEVWRTAKPARKIDDCGSCDGLNAVMRCPECGR